MCRWDWKKCTREARKPEFKSRPTIFDKNTSLRHRFFYPVLVTETFSLSFWVPVVEPVPKAFINRYQKPFFSSSVDSQITQDIADMPVNKCKNLRGWDNIVYNIQLLIKLCMYLSKYEFVSQQKQPRTHEIKWVSVLYELPINK